MKVKRKQGRTHSPKEMQKKGERVVVTFGLEVEEEEEEETRRMKVPEFRSALIYCTNIAFQRPSNL